MILKQLLNLKMDLGIIKEQETSTVLNHQGK